MQQKLVWGIAPAANEAFVIRVTPLLDSLLISLRPILFSRIVLQTLQ